MNELPVGTVVVIQLSNGVSITGKVRFASEHFVSVDEGGVTAAFHFDAASNEWLHGKQSVKRVQKTLASDTPKRVS